MKNKTEVGLLTIALAILTTLYSINSYAQETRDFTIQWSAPSQQTQAGITQYVPNFIGFSTAEGTVKFSYLEEVSSKTDIRFQLENYETAPADEKEKKFLENNNFHVAEEPEFHGKTSNGGGRRFISLSISAFVKKGNQILRVTNFTIKQQTSILSQNYKPKSFATESVLRPGTGSWYKIAVTQTGVHVISKALLSSMGINTSNLNPQHIHIYGNGDGRLPENVDGELTDDLAMNAIHIEGESDGVFDDSDYIIFYAKGPHRWDLNNTGTHFENVQHIYSNYSYYFININPNVAPLRIQTVNSSPQAATHFITNYDYYAVHEVETYNPTKSGQRWYGEKFDVTLSRNFNFSLPNPVVNAPTTVKVSVGSDSKETSSGNIQFSINGSLLSTIAVPSNSSGHFGRSTQTFNINNSNSAINVNITFLRNNPSVSAYLDKIEVNTRRQLTMMDQQFSFRDLPSVGPGNVGDFTIQNFPANGFVWDVTNRHIPQRINGNISGSTFNFVQSTSTLNEYVVSNGGNFLNPIFIESVNPQNLHALEQVDYLIITHPAFIQQANRLANLHRNFNNLSVHVVNINEIYNEFSGGAQDAAAIRQFAKMFYDRGTSPANTIKYLCLFGDGSYDPKNRIANNNNFIPTFQLSKNTFSEAPQGNILTDDFYGMLDDTDDINFNSIMDIGVGRIIANSSESAASQVNKIEHYMKNGSTFFTENNINCVDGVSTSTFGDWRTRITSIADMEDHFTQIEHEPGYQHLKANVPEINVNKLYMDAYNVQATVAGLRVPDLNKDIENSFYSGSLITNYVGHGGSTQLSEARLLTSSTIQELKNSDYLPLFVSATCDFTPFDDPELISAGELMAINPIGGAIAMMTTTRTVFYSTNTFVVSSFYQNALQRTANNEPRTFGDIIVNTKISVGINGSYDRVAFNLIGDPALRLALPRHKIIIDSINGLAPSAVVDTIQALSRVKVKAHVEDFSGNILTNFNGIATPVMYDKPKQMMTLGQKPGPTLYDANKVPFESQKNIIYRGQSTITNGHFSFEFIVPKDIDYAYGNGKFSLYGNSQQTDAIGEEQRIIIGGVNPQGLNDVVGPEINIFLNNENFVNGGLTDETPFLIAKLKDENGINTVGNGIGHDITIVIDEKSSQPLILNEYYKNDLDTYQSGELRYQLNKLEPGRHTLTLKVWDVNNNSSQETIEFIVQEKSELKLDHVLNYPNPFTTSTEFYFEHNQCCTDLETQIQIFTVSGRLVKTINKTIYTQGYRSEGIHWDGKDDFGDDIGRGVYVYRLKVRTPDGEIAEKLEKLVLL